jgi:hypothetical protein
LRMFVGPLVGAGIEQASARVTQEHLHRDYA